MRQRRPSISERGWIMSPYSYAAAATDPYFANVVLLLHGEGANGSTTFTDHSSFGKTVTVTGSTSVSTAEYKYGGSSIKGAANSRLSCALGTDGSMTGDFTIELFALEGSSKVIFAGPSGTGYLYNGAFQDYGGPSLSISTAQSSGVWNHYAISRTGSTIYAFKNGVLADSDTYSGTVNLQTVFLGYYPPNNNLHFTGYYDEVRVTNGVGRYTTGFTPPQAQFPDA